MRTELLGYERRITRDPRIMVGKPIVRGTRIPVERVIAHLAHTPDLTDLFEAYPELTVDDVKACLQYAHEAVERRPTPATRRQHSAPTAAPSGA